MSSLPIGIIGYGAVSALGRGLDAVQVSGEREVTRVARDEELAAGGLRRPFCARADVEPGPTEDRAAVLLAMALEDCLRAIGPEWRDKRIGLVVGTSSGGMCSFTSGAGTPMDRTYAGPVPAALRRAFDRVWGVDVDEGPRDAYEESPARVASATGASGAALRARVRLAPAGIVLAACASSAIAIGMGRAWLEDDRCDLVLAGGFDAVSVFVAAGFESLRATCGERGPRPFRVGRDGLALGEGGAMVAMAREPRAARAWVTGFGVTCDAYHLTSPIPDGSGLARAARAAWVEAAGSASAEDGGRVRVDLVSAHGTATAANDSAEAKAIAALQLGDTPTFSFKGTIGHTLGAAGALEALAAIAALERGVAPATAGEGEVEAGVVLHDRAVARAGRTALKLASAFGGANAALVLSLDRPAARTREARAVRVSRAVRAVAADIEPASLAARSGYPIDRVNRADDLVRYALAAVAALREQLGDAAVRGAGIVVGLGLATIETNALFQARIARPEPRRFPYTTPNAAAGECAVAFGLDGPAFAVGGGPHGGLEALATAADLVRAGVCERVVVVAADEAAAASEALAPDTTSGAIALLVSAQEAEAPRSGASGSVTEWGVSYEVPARSAGTGRVGEEALLPPMHAHVALLPLVAASSERELELRAEVPWGGHACVRVTWDGARET